LFQFYIHRLLLLPVSQEMSFFFGNQYRKYFYGKRLPGARRPNACWLLGCALSEGTPHARCQVVRLRLWSPSTTRVRSQLFVFVERDTVERVRSSSSSSLYVARVPPQNVGRTRAVDGLASILVIEYHEGTKPALCIRRDGYRRACTIILLFFYVCSTRFAWGSQA
jgi:hypothetical protein